MAYTTYQEAKIANPDQEIYELSGKFQTGDTPALPGENWRLCNPADYCMALSYFHNSGHKLVHGDLILGQDWSVVKVSNEHNYNQPWEGDNKRYVLKAKALEENKQEVKMNTYETMKHNIPEGATHHGVYGCDTDCYFKKDGETYLLWKDENWSLSPFEHHQWVKPIPQPTYRYEKVMDYIFDLKEEFERGELFSFDGDGHELQIETEGDFSYAHVHENLYRRIEVTERELELEAAYDLYVKCDNDPNNRFVYNDFVSGVDKNCPWNHVVNQWISVVKETGYRKSINDVNGKG